MQTHYEALIILKQIHILNDEIKLIPDFGDICLNNSTIAEKLGISQRFSCEIRFVIESYLLTQTKLRTPISDSFYRHDNTTKASQLDKFNTIETQNFVKCRENKENQVDFILFFGVLNLNFRVIKKLFFKFSIINNLLKVIKDQKTLKEIALLARKLSIN